MLIMEFLAFIFKIVTFKHLNLWAYQVKNSWTFQNARKHCVYDPCERMLTLLLAKYNSLSASSSMKIELNPYFMISTFAHPFYLA